MDNQLTIVMYHYVRELKASRYPEIKGLELAHFRNQLNYFSKFYSFVTVRDCLEHLQGGKQLPKNAILLSFDDAISDHYTNVFPLLDERSIEGIFFPPARAILEREMLDIHKIHFVLASGANPIELKTELFGQMNKYRHEFSLQENEYYETNFKKKMRFDNPDVGLIKKLLQRELPKELRKILIDELFAKYVNVDQKAFVEELYMSVDQIKTLHRNGMYVGSHCHDHVWLNRLEKDEQRRQIESSLEFLEIVGAPTKDWVMCYPHGGYDDSVIEILRQNHCAMAFAVEVGIAQLTPENAFTLPRLDTNDFPKDRQNTPNEWTNKVLK